MQELDEVYYSDFHTSKVGFEQNEPPNILGLILLIGLVLYIIIHMK